MTSIRSFATTLLLVTIGLPGCAALQQFAALSQVDFQFDRVSDVRIAGVAVSGGYSSLSAIDAARLAAAVASHNVPIDLVFHVRGTNPASNTVTARMIELGWTFFVEDRELVAGSLTQPYVFEPGRPTDVPIAMRFEAWNGGSGAQNLFELALAIAGVEGYSKEIRADLIPTIDTSLGRIRYPTPITVRRTVGG
jgi:hypothetical protein